jgi:rhodanese-related sulfurtransferase
MIYLELLLAAVFIAIGIRLFMGPHTPSAVARRAVKAGAPLVDVRTVDEFLAGHIEGARNIPLSELEARMPELDPPDRPVVVYCHTGIRSARAARTLRRAGFAQVLDLGPMRNW